MSDVNEVQLTYPEVGATAGVMPIGYRRIDVTRRIGRGQEWFEVASRRLLTWEMHRRSGLIVGTGEPAVTLDAVALLEIRLGPWRMRAPVRVELAGPIATRIQDVMTERYLAALTVEGIGVGRGRRSQ